MPGLTGSEASDEQMHLAEVGDRAYADDKKLRIEFYKKVLRDEPKTSAKQELDVKVRKEIDESEGDLADAKKRLRKLEEVAKDTEDETDASKAVAARKRVEVREDELAALKAKLWNGLPVFEEKDCIRIFIPGSRDITVREPCLDQPDRSDKRRFAAQYKAFKEGRGHVMDGTPIEYLANLPKPLISAVQVEEYRYRHVYTAEQILGLSAADGAGFMGIETLKVAIQRFLDVQKEEAPKANLIQALAERDEKLESQSKLISDLTARMAALDGGKAAPEPKKRGRPAKASAESTA